MATTFRRDYYWSSSKIYFGDEEVEVQALDEHPAETAEESKVEEDGDGLASFDSFTASVVESGEHEQFRQKEAEAEVPMDVEAEILAERPNPKEDNEGQKQTNGRDDETDESDPVQSLIIAIGKQAVVVHDDGKVGQVITLALDRSGLCDQHKQII